MKNYYFGSGLFAVVMLSSLAYAAFGAEAPVEKPVGPPASMTINDCLLVLQGLQAIDEHIVIIGNAPNQQTVKQSYEYGGNFRMNFLAHNIRVLTAVQQDAQAEQQKILRNILAKMPPVQEKDKEGKPTNKEHPATEISAGTPEAVEYDKRLKELTGAPCLTDLTHFKDSDLKLDKNELPGWALANLEKIRDK